MRLCWHVNLLLPDPLDKGNDRSIMMVVKLGK
jgi:hypothetical protein